MLFVLLKISIVPINNAGIFFSQKRNNELPVRRVYMKEICRLARTIPNPVKKLANRTFCQNIGARTIFCHVCRFRLRLFFLCNIIQLALPVGVSSSDQFVKIIQLLLNSLDADNAIQIDSQLFSKFGLRFAKICRDGFPVLELPSLPPDPILMLVAQKDSRRIIPGDKLLYMMLPNLPQCFLLIQ